MIEKLDIIHAFFSYGEQRNLEVRVDLGVKTLATYLARRPHTLSGLAIFLILLLTAVRALIEPSGERTFSTLTLTECLDNTSPVFYYFS